MILNRPQNVRLVHRKRSRYGALKNLANGHPDSPHRAEKRAPRRPQQADRRRATDAP